MISWKGRHYSEDSRPRTRRKTVNSIRRDRIARFITIPLYLFIMFFLMVPGLLVMLELSSRLVIESKLLGGLSLVAGIGLAALLFVHIISFRREDMDFLRTFVMVFLVFFLVITIGKLVSDNTLHFNQVLKRYKNSFKTYIKMFEEGAGDSSHTTSEAYFYSSIDSVAWDMADQNCVKDFFSYASGRYYQDLDSYILYLGVNEVMSVYRVMLEEFEVTDDDSDDIHQTDAETIIENRAGSHTQLTLFFTACLMQFDYEVELAKSINGNLINMVRINPGFYPHLKNFILNENLNHSPEPPAPYGKFAIYKARAGSIL